MSDGPSSIESRVGELERIVHALEHRIAAIDRLLVAASSGVAVSAEGSSRDEPARQSTIALSPPEDGADIRLLTGVRLDFVAVLSLVGRTCVILGGAYLLRALTEAGSWPTSVGVTLGFVYAMVWLGAADRAGSRGRRLSASFFGAVATVIALPLLWEADTRFRLIDGAAASVLLTAVTLAAIAVSVRQRLQPLAWISVLAALAASLAFTAAIGSVVAFALATTALGVATLWVGYTQDWVLLRWPLAIVADLMVLGLAMGMSARTVTYTPAVVIATQLLLLVGYLASIVVRTLVRGRDVVPFEIVQGSVALAVGFGGALYVAQATTFGRTMLVATGLVCGVACYAVAFAFVARRQGLRPNFYFYTSLALVLVLASTGLLLAQAPLLWATLAVLASAAAWRVGRVALSLHAAAYAIAAAFASGLITWAATTWVGSTASLTEIPPPALPVLAALCVCWSIPLQPAVRRTGWPSRLPRLAIGAAFTWAAGAGFVAFVVAAISRTVGAPEAGAIETIRTVGLAVAAIALASAARFDRFREAEWLVYPALLAGAVKLIAEDFPHSRPATLFVALAFYGGALIAAPRIGHTRR
jgi:hypothetical protein